MIFIFYLIQNIDNSEGYIEILILNMDLTNNPNISHSASYFMRVMHAYHFVYCHAVAHLKV